MSMRSRHRAVYPGVFDPITLGHLDIVRRAAHIFDSLIVAVADSKRSLFNQVERLEMATAEITRLGSDWDCAIEILPFSGLLVRFANQHQADAIVRGIRPVADFEYEFKMAVANSALDPSLETVFLMASARHHFTSASLVREVASLQGPTKAFVTPPITKCLKKKFQH